MGSQAVLLLEDGTEYRGQSLGATGERVAEVCFNTSMMGYQEIITDPSYHGQMVAMTYPLIGNYGVNVEDAESIRPQVGAFIVKEVARRYSNFRAQESLPQYLRKHDIVGISGIDTRALTRRLRVEGSMMGILSSVDTDTASLTAKLAAAPKYVGTDQVQFVTTQEPYTWSGDNQQPALEAGAAAEPTLFDGATEAPRFHVVCLDCGVKFNSLRELAARGCRVTVMPASSSADAIFAQKPDGVYLSNGPGDPAPLTYIHDTVRALAKAETPLFGICLGHQMISLALGGKTFKLKFGHRGGNQPVMDLSTQHVEITSQNHGFAVDADSLKGTGLKVTHINLNDHTVEGMQHQSLPIFSVQYHPEASPGPHDANYLFDRFIEAMIARQN